MTSSSDISHSAAAIRMRRLRAAEWGQCAQLTFDRKIPTADVCLRWSLFADRLLEEAFTETQKLCPLETPIALLAYGKLGAHELNLSSDVDLLLISKNEDSKLNEWMRIFRQLGQDRTDEGFCFRLDFDLRPGGKWGPLVPTLAQFDDYFANYGEAWERLAFIRFRQVAGDAQLAKACLDVAEKFTYRRHLDFRIMEDLRFLRQRLYEQNWQRSQNQALDLKLGPGGIRDLELFVHAQQVIHGGKNPQLRTRSTGQALELLSKHQILTKEDSDFLLVHYWELRHYENFLQAKTDQQIQILKTEDFVGEISTLERTKMQIQMGFCAKKVTTLLGEVETHRQSLPEDEPAQMAWLESLGYSNALIEETWPPLIRKGVLSRQSEKDEIFRKRFLYQMLTRLSETAFSKDLSFAVFSDFLKAIRAKATFFHLILENPPIFEKLVLLFSSSPNLSQILTRRPELLDSFLYAASDLPTEADLEQVLAFCIEKKLLTQLSSGLDFLQDHKLPRLLSALSESADEIVLRILDHLNREYQTQVQILALGKWGGLELGVHSDLDLVFIADQDQNEISLKVAKRLIARLTEVQKGGSLFQLDFRLRPGGKGGLLITTPQVLLEYLSGEAAPWERQAYLKARVLRNPHLTSKIRKKILSRALTPEDWVELKRIRQGLVDKSRGDLDLKYQPGGLISTEFCLQLFLLKSQAPFSGTSTGDLFSAAEIQDSHWSRVRQIYSEIRKVEQTLRLVCAQSTSSVARDSSELIALAQALSLTSDQLAQRISSLLVENAVLLTHLDPRETSG